MNDLYDWNRLTTTIDRVISLKGHESLFKHWIEKGIWVSINETKLAYAQQKKGGPITLNNIINSGGKKQSATHLPKPSIDMVFEPQSHMQF